MAGKLRFRSFQQLPFGPAWTVIVAYAGIGMKSWEVIGADLIFRRGGAGLSINGFSDRGHGQCGKTAARKRSRREISLRSIFISNSFAFPFLELSDPSPFL